MSITMIRSALKDRTVRALELMAYADPSGMVYLDDFYTPLPEQSRSSEATATAEVAPRAGGHDRLPKAA